MVANTRHIHRKKTLCFCDSTLACLKSTFFHKIIWFEDKLLADRVHADVCAFLAAAGTKRAGDNRAPKFQLSHHLLEQTVSHCAREAGIRIVQEQDIFRARGLRDSKVLREIGR